MPTFSRSLEQSLHRALALANERHHEYATLEHLLLALIEDQDAAGDVAKVYDEWRAKSGRQKMPGILKCFSHRPDFLREVMKFSDTVHFSEGHLNRKTKEAIASWVSYLNRCPY